MSSIFTKFKKFLGKHSGEVSGVASALGTIAQVLPLDRSDKQKIVAVADRLEKASKSINDSIKKMTDEAVTFNDSDVLRAVGAFLKSPEGKKLIKQAVTDNSGADLAKAAKDHVTAPVKDAPKSFG